MPNYSEFFRDYSLSFKDYMDKALFDPQWGYYSSGTVNFEKDFQTYAQAFAPLFAVRCFTIWRAMVANHETTKEARFYIYEFGAGDGDMALQFVSYVHGMAVRFPETEWQSFFTAMHYIIGEISPALVTKQKKLLDKYILLDKVGIYNIDAKKIDDKFPKGIGVVLSNELIDAFPVHKVKLTFDKNLNQFQKEVIYVVPSLPKGYAISGNIEVGLSMPEDLQQEFINQNRYPISNQQMHNLLTTNKRSHSKNIKMIPHARTLDSLDSIDKARIESMLANYNDLLKSVIDKFNNNEFIIYLHTSMYDYVEKIPTFLTKGYDITADYGHNAYEYIKYLADGVITLNSFSKAHRDNPLSLFQRGIDGTSLFQLLGMFANAPTPLTLNNQGYSEKINSALNHPGELDMTMQVNFSDFDFISENHGLTSIFYGTQDALGSFFLEMFKILIQEFNINPEVAVNCRELITQDLPKTVPFSYASMPRFQHEISHAQALLAKLSANYNWENFKAVLDWFIVAGYLTHNRACVSFIEAELFGPTQGKSFSNIGGIVTYDCFNSLCRIYNDENIDKQTEALAKKCFLTEVLKNENYAEVLLSFLMHNRHLSETEEQSDYLDKMEFTFEKITKDITDRYPRLAEREKVFYEKRKNYNFIVMDNKEKQNTELSITLIMAQQELEKQIGSDYSRTPAKNL